MCSPELEQVGKLDDLPWVDEEKVFHIDKVSQPHGDHTLLG